MMADDRCESCRKVLGRGWKYDSAGEVKLCPRCYRELSEDGVAQKAQDRVMELLTPFPDAAKLRIITAVARFYGVEPLPPGEGER